GHPRPDCPTAPTRCRAMLTRGTLPTPSSGPTCVCGTPAHAVREQMLPWRATSEGVFRGFGADGPQNPYQSPPKASRARPDNGLICDDEFDPSLNIKLTKLIIRTFPPPAGPSSAARAT